MKRSLLRPKGAFRTALFRSLALLSIIPLMGIAVVYAQEPSPVPHAGDSNPTLVQSLNDFGAQISYHADTGQARFIGSTPGRPISQPTALRQGASGEDAARGFLAAYGPLFGIRDQSRELKLMIEKKPDAARTFDRFQQIYNGIPVIGGEIIVQVDSNNNILSANGETLPKIAVSTTPTIDASTASQNALNAVATKYSLQVGDLTTTTPELWIYNPSLIGPGTGITQLVWRMEVLPKALEPIREFVLVDALRGGVALQFGQIENVLNRQTYTANNGTTVPGTLICTESNPTCSNGDADAQGAHRGAGATYNFYSSVLGRNSIDNAGMIIKSTVHYKVGYNNAFWSGQYLQMVYGDGKTYAQADDVVGHELTHGVTQYESGLFYYYQSGAINESFSDVFGEFVDQTDGIGDDSSGVKWLMGEDVSPGGALRDMADPTLFGDPDKMTSPNYHTIVDETSLYFDNGGVHTNSGINNKAAFLMTDGGTFNGKTVTGSGITKVAKIYYEVQRNFLTSGADYNDLYNALNQACLNLIGTAGINSADCQEVRDATDAVEMNAQPIAGFSTDASLCPAGMNPEKAIFFDNLEAGATNWLVGYDQFNRWYYDSPYGNYAHSGTHFLYADDSPALSSIAYVYMKTGYLLPANAYLHFYQAYGFQGTSSDGGVLEYSTDNGVNWFDAGSLIEVNGYDGAISSLSNPLYGRNAFIGDSHGYISTRVNLTSLAGQSVRFRWFMGLNSTDYDWGWWLDDIGINACATQPANDNFASPISMTSPPYTNTQTNAAASKELFEQTGSCETAANIQKTVWYTYTSTGIEPVNFVATGSTTVKGISVWTGSSLGSLTQVGCATGATATTAVNTTNGTVYHIRVGTSNGVSGNLTVQANPVLAAPVRNYFTTATPTLTWNRVSTATAYLVQVSTSNTFGSFAFVTTPALPPSQLSVTTTALVKGTYYWRVSANGGTTWSAVDSFVVDIP